MKASERERFDALLERMLSSLPRAIHELLEESPLIVEDHPGSDVLKDLGMRDEERDELCGLHSGVPLTERSVAQAADLPEQILIYREGIIEHAGGWEPWEDEDSEQWGGEARIAEEIHITILHEIGHHFGLEEDDLERLGYG